MPTRDIKQHASPVIERSHLPLRRSLTEPTSETGKIGTSQARWLTVGTLFSELADIDRERWPLRADYKQASTKEVIFYKGDPATHLYMVVSGKVKVSAPSEDGKEITFGILGPGELVGEMGVIDGADHTATVTALEPTELAVLNQRDFLSLLENCPSVALKLLKILCERLRRTSEMAEDISFLPLPVRLAKRLYALAQNYGDRTPSGIQIGLHLCQQDLANLVSTSRESINKQLAIWQAEGLVGMSRGHLTVYNIAELASLAGIEEHTHSHRLAMVN